MHIARPAGWVVLEASASSSVPIMEGTVDSEGV